MPFSSSTVSHCLVRWIPEVRMPRFERMIGRALQKIGERLNSGIAGIKLLPAVSLNELARKDDLVLGPIRIGQEPHCEAQDLQPVSHRFISTSEVL